MAWSSEWSHWDTDTPENALAIYEIDPMRKTSQCRSLRSQTNRKVTAKTAFVGVNHIAACGPAWGRGGAGAAEDRGLRGFNCSSRAAVCLQPGDT